MKTKYTNSKYLIQYAGKWCLITGGSRGLGFEYAQIFASSDINLIIVARNEKTLNESIQKLIETYPSIKVKGFCLDLSTDEGVCKLVTKLFEWDPQVRIEILVNNAAQQLRGRFDDAKIDDIIRSLRLNVVTPVQLMHSFRTSLSLIINIGSAAAFQPIPGFALYSATKAFLYSFSLALAHESQMQAKKVQIVCPNVLLTESTLNQNLPSHMLKQGIEPKNFVKKAIENLNSDQPRFEIGFRPVIQRIFAAIFPVKFVLSKVDEFFNG